MQQLGHALILTLVRMGLTHDLYELANNKPPSYAAGGVALAESEAYVPEAQVVSASAFSFASSVIIGSTA